MSVSTIVLMQHMPAVVFACTLGTVEDVETYLVCFRGGEITAVVYKFIFKIKKNLQKYGIL